MSLPSLPRQATPWSSNVYEANSLLRELYRRPVALLASGSYNRHQVKQHQNLILEEAIPLLLEIEEAAHDKEILLQWIYDVSDHFARILVELDQAKAATGDR